MLFSRRRALLLLPLLTILLHAGVAEAAGIAITESGVNVLHEGTTNRYWISRADCVAQPQLALNFPIVLTDFLGLGLEVWETTAGTDCTQPAARTTGSATCSLVYTIAPTSAISSVVIPVRDIVGKQIGAPVSVCNGTSSLSTPVTLSFMLLSGDAAQASTPWTQTSVDLVGPAAPTDLNLGIGHTLLKASWTPGGGSDLTGYQFLCDPPLNGDGGAITDAGGYMRAPATSDAASAATDAATGAVDAGGDAAVDGGSGGAPGSTGSGGSTATDASTGTPSHCASLVLQNGLIPDPALVATYQCGSAGKTSSSATIDGLTDNTTYTVAVVSTDAIGNYGPLSGTAIDCETPQLVTGFFEALRDAGSTAGGDSFASCSFAPSGRRPAATFGAVVTALLGLSALWRRRSANR
jgi:hypothetical protein